MRCVIYGTATSFLGDVLATLHRLEWEPVGFVLGGDDDIEPPPSSLAPREVPPEWRELPVVVPVLTASVRRRLVAEARADGFTRFPPVVDPTAVIPHDIVLGDGCMLNAGTVVGAGVEVGAFAVVNRAASIGHDGTIGEYAFVGPGATTCGRVSIGSSTVIGAGSVVVPGRTIGTACVVVAGSVVFSDVGDGTVVRGNPAEVVKVGLTSDDTRI